MLYSCVNVLQLTTDVIYHLLVYPKVSLNPPHQILIRIAGADCTGSLRIPS